MSATTWNPSDKGANVTLSNGNLDATVASGAAFHSVRATNGLSSGKKYFEILVVAQASTPTGASVGIATSAFTLTGVLGSTSTSAGYQDATGWTVSGMTQSDATSSSYNTTSNVVAISVDLGAGKMWFAINNTWVQGSPSAGTSPSVTFTAGSVFFPTVSIYPWATADTLRLKPIAAAQTYSAPSGFTPWDPIAYSVAPAAGAFTLTGVAATLRKGLNLVVTAGSYTLSGVATVVKKAIRIVPATGSLVLTGITATLGKGYKALTAVAGTYALTGVAASLFRGARLVAAAGSYALTGVATVVKKALHLTAAKGTIVLTGINAALAKTITLVASVGHYTLTGITLVVAEAVAAARKFRRRITQPTLRQ